MKVLMILNPVAGGSDKTSFIEKAKKYANSIAIDLNIYQSKKADTPDDFTNNIRSKDYDKILAAGGDGTVLDVAIALKEMDLPMGIIPLGTSNGLATDLGLNQDSLSCFQQLMASKHHIQFDFICLNRNRHFLHLGDIGANANLIRRFESGERERRGYTAFASHFINELREMKAFHYKIVNDKKTYEGKAYMIAFCNARRFGSGIPLNLNGNPADGKFELVILNEINVLTLLKASLADFSYFFEKSQNKEVLQLESAEIFLNESVECQIDGELIGKQDHLQLEVLKHQIRLMVTDDCPYLAAVE